ncbi:hypothetical protein IT087_01255 [Candidatus Uhrbacteria bacterium]|nr:hypothetical protein [Candidatus Uhrbacteria bacterium]
MSYARVVPVLRTPAGLDAFDYAVPDGLDLRVGDLVWVPFRKQKTPALVTELLKTSPFAKQAKDVIGLYADIRFPEATVGLMRWLADWTFASQPAILLAWLRGLPKRPETKAEIKKVSEKGAMSAFWIADPDRQLIEAAKKAKGRVLIVTPWLASAKRLANHLPGSSLLLAEQADGTYFEQWTNWATSPKGILITTRVGSWLSPIAHEVLLHLPEQDDHKQDELTPRYDARRIAAWSAQHAGTMVRAFGVTPPLSSDEASPDISLPLEVRVRSPKGHSPIPSLQADVLNIIRDHQGPRIIVHGIRGKGARFVCRDCSWSPVCARCDFPLSDDGTHASCRRCGWMGEPPLSCLSCGGTDLGKSLPGIDRLKAAWQKYEADILVEWRTLAIDEQEAALPEGCLVAVTDATLLCGVVEDIRRDERLVIGIRHLASRVAAAHGSLVLQTAEHEAVLIETCLTSDGEQAFRARDRALRAEFGYPPAARIVKAITTKPTLNVHGNWCTVRGPFPVLYRPKSQAPRFIFHLIPSKDLSHRELMDRLKPLAKTAILDLDPIAFFR